MRTQREADSGERSAVDVAPHEDAQVDDGTA